MAPKGPSKRPKVTDFDKLKQEITTYTTLDEKYKPHQSQVVDQYFRYYKIDTLLQNNVVRYTKVLKDAKQPAEVLLRLQRFTRDISELDVDVNISSASTPGQKLKQEDMQQNPLSATFSLAGIDSNDLKNRDLADLIKNYHELYKKIEKVDKYPELESAPFSHLPNDTTGNNDRNYNYSNVKDLLMENYADVDIEENNQAIKYRSISQKDMKYLALMLFNPEILQYCACRITKNDSGDKDYQLVYLKDPDKPKFLFLSNFNQYSKYHTDPTKWDAADKRCVGIRENFSNEELGIDKSTTADFKMSQLQKHFNTNRKLAESETEYTSVTDDSASEFEASSIEATEDQGDQKLESAQSLSASRVIERTNLLKDRCKQEGSFIYKMLNFFGINTDIVLGLVASNASIPDNELKLTIGAGMVAIAKSGFKRFTKHLPSSLLGIKEQDSEAKFPIEPELKDKLLQPVQLGTCLKDLSRKTNYIPQDLGL